MTRRSRRADDRRWSDGCANVGLRSDRPAAGGDGGTELAVGARGGIDDLARLEEFRPEFAVAVSTRSTTRSTNAPATSMTQIRESLRMSVTRTGRPVAEFLLRVDADGTAEVALARRTVRRGRLTQAFRRRCTGVLRCLQQSRCGDQAVHSSAGVRPRGTHRVLLINAGCRRRVFHSDRDGWVLKGDQALPVCWPRARYATDVDLLRVGEDATVDGAVDALLAAVSIELDDHLTFEHHDTSRETAADRPSRKVRFKVMFGLRQLSTVSVDVVAAELHPVGQFTVEQLEAALSSTPARGRRSACGRSKTHVADKIAAMYDGIVNNWCRPAGSRTSSTSC